MSTYKETPLIHQYRTIRKQHPDSLLLFQVGDFYELFFEDAQRASAFLGLALTKRGKSNGEDIPLCGIPVHALKHYLAKLVKGGFKVALCDQLSEPKPGTIVERGVTQVFSPGTLIDDSMLDQKSASYLLSLFPGEERWGLLFGELLSAQLFATTFPAGSLSYLENELARFIPDEVILPTSSRNSSIDSYLKNHGFWVSWSHLELPGEDVTCKEISSAQFIQNFNSKSRELLANDREICQSATLLYSYLQRTQPQSVTQFGSIQFYTPDDYVYLDATTLKTLELVKNCSDGSTKNTLFAVVDHAQTAMGSRTLKKWLNRPLVQKEAILQRQSVVSFFRNNSLIMQQCKEILSSIADLERIVGRIALRKASVNDYLLLKNSLKVINGLRDCLNKAQNSEFARFLGSNLFDFSSLVKLLENSLVESLGGSHTIKRNFDPELDRLRDLVENTQQKLLALEVQEIKKTGIESLKIRFNKVMGYAIEITKANFDKIPDYYIRQQTLSNRERFVTRELLELEREITQAHNQITPYENSVFESVKREVETNLSYLRKTAYATAVCDALYAFAHAAYEYNYVAPTFHEGHDIIIQEGRHAVVEQALEGAFIANDTKLTDEQSLYIITGPNMGGKSTYLRQVAHISILAQCGSFVPAKSASLPIIDKLFTRIGSGDNLADGKSTFLVEMEETARICRHATASSLVILDEVGRGTSTYDGLAIAQAVVEYLHTIIKVRCLFATHYHELTALNAHYPAIVPYYMESRKNSQGIIFLHKLVCGSAEQSFGIEVAQLAALPQPIITRAKQLVKEYGVSESLPSHALTLHQKEFLFINSELEQLKTALHTSQAVIDKLKEVDLDIVSPKDALTILWNLKSKI